MNSARNQAVTKMLFDVEKSIFSRAEDSLYLIMPVYQIYTSYLFDTPLSKQLVLFIPPLTLTNQYCWGIEIVSRL